MSEDKKLSSSGNDPGRGSTGWRPIGSAPRELDEHGYRPRVLLAVTKQDGRRAVGEAHWTQGEWWWAGEDPGDNHAEPVESYWTITHWMPLPDPPEGQ